MSQYDPTNTNPNDNPCIDMGSLMNMYASSSPSASLALAVTGPPSLSHDQDQSGNFEIGPDGSFTSHGFAKSSLKPAFAERAGPRQSDAGAQLFSQPALPTEGRGALRFSEPEFGHEGNEHPTLRQTRRHNEIHDGLRQRPSHPPPTGGHTFRAKLPDTTFKSSYNPLQETQKRESCVSSFVSKIKANPILFGVLIISVIAIFAILSIRAKNKAKYYSS